MSNNNNGGLLKAQLWCVKDVQACISIANSNLQDLWTLGAKIFEGRAKPEDRLWEKIPARMSR